MSEKITLTEDTATEIMEQWRIDMKNQTIETLPSFINHIMNDYEHDYETICHAISICGVATMWACDKHEQGGITGFQAGAIMWENITNWDSSKKGKPLRHVDFTNMLYPQYDYKFEKTISKGTMDYLQKEAQTRLDSTPDASEIVIAHWRATASGHIPFGYTIEKENK